MKESRFFILTVVMAVLSVGVFTSCGGSGGDDGGDDGGGSVTDHPEHGKITLAMDWSRIGAGLSAPQNYTVKVGDYSATLSGTSNTLNQLFDPGSYKVCVYNAASHITVSGTTATANYSAGDPGFFFSGVINAQIKADTKHDFTAVMQQQVRELTLTIEPKGTQIDRIAMVSGTLSGVAGSLNLENASPGSATTVAVTFTGDAASDNYQAKLNLLGVTGNSQKLKITVSYTDGSPADQLEEYDLTSLLASFNSDKKTPLTLTSQIVVTPTGIGVTSTITGWKPIKRDPIIVE